jgi:hypothetical protein
VTAVVDASYRRGWRLRCKPSGRRCARAMKRAQHGRWRAAVRAWLAGAREPAVRPLTAYEVV